MRPMGGPASFYLPSNFNSGESAGSSDPSRVTNNVSPRLSLQTYLSGSNTNPGYAYGTFIPLLDRGSWFARFKYPYTVPMAASSPNTVPATWKNNVQWINPERRMRLKGLVTNLPGVDTSQLDAIQTYLGNAQG